jgi:hypothetical protein
MSLVHRRSDVGLVRGGTMTASRGNRGQAQGHPAIATAIYREMGMTYWLEQVAVEMRQLG